MSRRSARDAANRQTAPLGGEREPFSRRELALVAFILACGLGLRCSFPARIAIEHFDEGVYASNLWFESGAYPYRFLYAPWLAPLLFELSMLVFGPEGYGPCVASQAAGLGTLLSIWWLARTWFGRQAALFSLALASCSDLHAVLCRMALTDALLLFWLVWAVYFLVECLSVDGVSGVSDTGPSERQMTGRPGISRRAGNCLACGVFTGLAWSTKYNGWLPLAIALAAIGLLAAHHATRRETARRAISWFAIALVAGAFFLPIWISLWPHGGYSAVSANHARYVVGLAGWPRSAEQQLANLAHFEGWATLLAPVVGLVSATWLDIRGRKTWAFPMFAAAVLSIYMLAASAILGAATVSVSLAFAASIYYCLTRGGVRDEPATLLAPVAVVFVWLVGLLLATPFYTPYARLTLPLLAASWIGAGLAARLFIAAGDRWQNEATTQAGALAPRRIWQTVGMAGALLSMCLIVWQGGRITERGVPAWQDQRGLQSVAERAKEALHALPGGDEMLFLVYGEPALFYHLRANGLAAIPIGDLSVAYRDGPWHSAGVYLAVGPHARQDGQFLAEWERASSRFELVSEFAYFLSDITLLDTHHPRDLRARERPQATIEIYRLK